MASYLTVYTSEPERLWQSLLDAATRLNAEISGTPPDFAIVLESARLFLSRLDEGEPVPDAIRRRVGPSCAGVVVRYRGSAPAEELLAAAIGALDVFVEDDDERVMTSVEFVARTRAWRNRRQRWASRATDGPYALVPLLAYVDGRAGATVLDAAQGAARALASCRANWVVGPPECVDEVDEDGVRTVGLVLWLYSASRPIEPALDDALLADVRLFVEGLERMSAETGAELELELAGERVGRIDRDGDTGEFTELLKMWRHRGV